MLPRRYGESKVAQCVFCPHTAYAYNAQRLPVCKDHKDQTLGDLVCYCKETLEIKMGKFGPFFLCPNCGPISLAKAQDLIQGAAAPAKLSAPAPSAPEKSAREETVQPDDPRYFE